MWVCCAGAAGLLVSDPVPGAVSKGGRSFAPVRIRPCDRRISSLSIFAAHSLRIAELRPDVFFLGAGEVDLKVGFSAADFVAAYKASQPLLCKTRMWVTRQLRSCTFKPRGAQLDPATTSR